MALKESVSCCKITIIDMNIITIKGVARYPHINGVLTHIYMNFRNLDYIIIIT